MAKKNEIKLADCVELQSGFAFKSNHFTDAEDDIVLVKGENVSQGRILWEISKRWPAKDWEGLKKFQLQEGDVVVAMDRPWVPAGLKWAYIRKNDPKALLVQRVARLRGIGGRIHQKFLSLIIGGPSFESYIRPITTGVNVPHISGKQILDFEFSLPAFSVQQRIAEILSAYDDLIENNRRRIKILEQMSRSLYREWFVHFRFPGYRSVPITNSPLGRIPKGWEVIPFKKLLLSASGGDWGSEEPTDEESCEVLVVRGTDFDDLAYGEEIHSPIRYIKPKSLETRELKVGDVIVENSINAKSRCVGTPLIVDERVLERLGRDSIAASFCKVFRFNHTLIAPLAFLHIRHLRETSRMEFYQNVATNGIGNFQTQKFASEECLMFPADKKTQEKIIEPLNSIIHQVSILASRILYLRKTRDLLLPRLLTGQIPFEEKVPVA